MSFDKKTERHISSPPNAIRLIEEEQAQLLTLCDSLEKIADELPYKLERGRLRPDAPTIVARQLRHRLPRLHRHIEQLLFPMLKKRALPEDCVEEIIAGFTHEHAMDDGYALGVLEVLNELSLDRRLPGLRAINDEAAGYLLRGFFEALRRHLRWQHFIVLRLARQRLTDKDLAKLARQISIDGS